MPEATAVNSKRLTAREVGALLGYNEFTVYRWARLGRIPCIRLAGRQIRFRLSDILQWEDEQTTGKL